MKKGTKITYRGGNSNPEKDNRHFFKSNRKNNKKVSTDYNEEEFIESMKDEDMAYMYITDDNLFGVCKLWYKEFPFLLLEPNPVTFYYSLAFDVCSQVEESHRQLNEILKSDLDYKEKRNKLAEAYSFIFKIDSVGIIFSFLSIEAFLNQQLPQYNSTVIYKGKEISKERVERYFSFIEKLDFVIPQLSGKFFSTIHPRKREIIQKLIDLRHEMTHLKQKRGTGVTRYEDLYQKVLDIDINKVVRTVKTLINFYHPKLIVNYKYGYTPAKKVML